MSVEIRGTWSWADHACRFCGARMARRSDGPGGEARPVFQCGGCGVESVGEPDGVCGCGILPKTNRVGPRFRCVPNPNRGVASPNAIVIEFSEAPAQTRDARS